ncbi:MAG: glycosyltransferase [Dehalococcoidia bacterium]
MLYQIIIAAGLTLFVLNIVLNLRTLKKPDNRGGLPDPAPLISVMVPARNEEANITACLDSLRKQDYPDFEILVLDDNSTDKTAVLVQGLEEIDNRIQLINGEPLPEGWAGKPFACYQMALRAKGEWLLFVDADTIHAPYMLRSVLKMTIANGASMLSGFPRQIANSLPQKIAIPVIYFIIFSWLQLWWLHKPEKQRPSLAIGQFLFFPRGEYWRIGGHKAVCNKILEDVWLSIEISRHRGRHITVDLSPVVSCNMYHTLPAMWEGFIKWMYSVATMSSVALLALIIAGLVFYLAPFYWLWNELQITLNPTEWRVIIVFQIALIFIARWLVDSRFKEPLISTVLHPAGFSYLIAAVLYGCMQRLMGKSVCWKNRLYSENSGVK